MTTSVVCFNAGSALTGASRQDSSILLYPFAPSSADARPVALRLTDSCILTTVKSHDKLHLIQAAVNEEFTPFALSAAARWIAVVVSERDTLVVSSMEHYGSEMRWTNSSQCQGRCKSRRMRRNCRGSTAIW